MDVFAQDKDNFESVVMEHIRMNGAYWGLTTLDILGKLNTVDQDEVVSWMMQCQHESGLCLFYFVSSFKFLSALLLLSLRLRIVLRGVTFLLAVLLLFWSLLHCPEEEWIFCFIGS